jgi:hypothetical protein
MWHLIFEIVPKDRDVILAVLDHDNFHALEFPCRYSEDGRWIDATTGPVNRGPPDALARVAWCC